MEKYNKLCKGYYDHQYSGPHACAYNVAFSFVETNRFMTETFSADPTSWKWGSVHVNYYETKPWTVIKYVRGIFDRATPTGGNANTISNSRYAYSLQKILENKRVESFSSA